MSPQRAGSAALFPVGNSVRLTVGAGHLDRVLEDAEQLLVAYRTDDGLRYLDFQPSTNPHRVMPEDLAVTILINSRVGAAAFKSVQDRAGELGLDRLPSVSLEETTPEERAQVADVIATMTSWRGFAASVATKILHKKRPALIPILDNEAIFGAYMNPRWPAHRASQDSVYARSRIGEALEWITTDLRRADNAATWRGLSELEPTRSRTELFDMVWWVYFRSVQSPQAARNDSVAPDRLSRPAG